MHNPQIYKIRAFLQNANLHQERLGIKAKNIAYSDSFSAGLTITIESS